MSYALNIDHSIFPHPQMDSDSEIKISKKKAPIGPNPEKAQRTPQKYASDMIIKPKNNQIKQEISQNISKNSKNIRSCYPVSCIIITSILAISFTSFVIYSLAVNKKDSNLVPYFKDGYKCKGLYYQSLVYFNKTSNISEIFCVKKCPKNNTNIENELKICKNSKKCDISSKPISFNFLNIKNCFNSQNLIHRSIDTLSSEFNTYILGFVISIAVILA